MAASECKYVFLGLVKHLLHTLLPGPAPRAEDAGPEPARAGDPGPHQRDRKKRLHLFPRLLQSGAEEISGGGRDSLQTKYVQSEQQTQLVCRPSWGN